MRSNSTLRIQIFSGLIVFVALVGIGRLYYLQLISGSAFRQKADRQYIAPSKGTFNRGTIFFQDKDGNKISAATLRSGFFLTINPTLIVDPEETYQKINAAIPIDHDTFIAKATKKGDSYEEILHRISDDQAAPLLNQKIAGVQLYKEYWRFYPSGAQAGQTLGFVAFKGNDLIGRYGLESQYQETLQRSSEDLYVNPFAQFFSDVKNVATSKQEGDVVTTIEPTVQQFLEDQLQKTTKKWNSTMTGGIIINPMNGEIYALGAYPSFDPNNFGSEKDVSIYSNPLIENAYEMGSIVKPLTMAAGIDAGVISTSSTYTDTGSITVDGRKISNYDGKARGPHTSMQTILNDSLNVGAAYVESKLGNNLFSQYFYNYGFGSRTGIDLPNETPGLVSNLKSPRNVEHTTASFGQGIALSPIAITRALSVLANGGTLINPHVVSEIEYTDGLHTNTPIVDGKRVISQKTSDQITGMLINVVDEALLKGAVKIDNYTIAAKTGTAQMSKENGGGYYTDRYLHSFFGYFPAHNPKFLIFLYTVYPKGVDYASHTLTEPFITTTKFLISYYQLQPDR